ncbi:22104_t:CDS:1 [Cetraspora pellucida]|uniref:22104_t:CDS:1 n=1 Tax=Cetraspora pellucida TaxID=1433469 RepID=A0A9N9FJD1_9GLOM|nr:22104_t:CDS:1 [Cetraspora pellucida]
MSPRTNSPPPSSYGLDDNIEYAEYNPGSSYCPSTPAGGQSSNINNQFYSTQCPVSPHSTPSLSRSGITDATATRARARNGSRKAKNNSAGLSALLPRTLNLPRKILSSSAVQFFTLIVIYSFCITTICFIFCASYFLTLYDDTRRMLRNSRAWAKVKSGVREKISMLGDDWDEFLQNYFDQTCDANKNSHLGGANMNNHGQTSSEGGQDEWEEWLKCTMFKFITVVAGQDATIKFQQSAASFQSTFFARPTTAASDGGKR